VIVFKENDSINKKKEFNAGPPAKKNSDLAASST
jgi:hypothetical protein